MTSSDLRIDPGMTPSECTELQRRLSGRVSRVWDGRDIGLVMGADVHFPSKDTARAALAVFTFPALELVETATADAPCVMPYIPGLLSFREIPPLLAAFSKIESGVDLILCDSHGIAHPRGLGMASHLGLILGIPTIGCAKSRLFGTCEDPAGPKGSRSPLREGDGEVIGCVLRTRDDTRPVFVSSGHMIGLEKAVEVVLACCPKFRIPVPLKEAHVLAGS